MKKTQHDETDAIPSARSGKVLESVMAKIVGFLLIVALFFGLNFMIEYITGVSPMDTFLQFLGVAEEHTEVLSEQVEKVKEKVLDR